MSTEGQLEAARLEYVEGRRRKTDFALWRAEEPGQTPGAALGLPVGLGRAGLAPGVLGDEHGPARPAFRPAHRRRGPPRAAPRERDRAEPGVPRRRQAVGAVLAAQRVPAAGRREDGQVGGRRAPAGRPDRRPATTRWPTGCSCSAVTTAASSISPPRRWTPPRPRCAGWSPGSSRCARCPPSRPSPTPPRHASGDPAAMRLLDTIDAAIAADLSTPKILAALQDALREPALTPDGLRAVVAAADALLGLGLATLDPGDLEQRRAHRRPVRPGAARHRRARRRPDPGPQGARLGPRRPDPCPARRARRGPHRHPGRPRLAAPLTASPFGS